METRFGKVSSGKERQTPSREIEDHATVSLTMASVLYVFSHQDMVRGLLFDASWWLVRIGFTQNNKRRMSTYFFYS